MSESQNIEYKSSWHDEYLDWICGFANAQGGKIYIGKDDAGNVIGVADYKDLMEKIPNKIKNLMGITAEVNLKQDGKLDYIEIVVTPYSVPISLRGRYYYRSGSVKQELTGNSPQ
jgi:ATP-dependent DNA helicase RecG